MRYSRLLTAAPAAALATPLFAKSLPAGAASQARGTARSNHARAAATDAAPLPAPPRPPTKRPHVPAGFRAPAGLGYTFVGPAGLPG